MIIIIIAMPITSSSATMIVTLKTTLDPTTMSSSTLKIIVATTALPTKT